MSFFSDLKNKNRDGFYIVLEVLDSSIAFSLLAVKGKSYEALAQVSLSHRISVSDGLNQPEIKKFADIITKGFTLISEKVGKILTKKNKIKIRNAVAVIFYPWFSFEKRENIQVGRQGEMNYIRVEAVEDALRGSVLSGLQDDHPIAAYIHKRSIIETFINDIRLNGYSVSNLIGKKAKDIKISACFYTSYKALLDCLKKEIHFHTSVNPKIITFPRACALFAKRVSLKSPALFIGVEDKMTSICSVSEEPSMVYKIQTIDFGLDDIIKSVMEKSGSEREVALSYIRLLDEGLLTDNISNLVKSALEDAIEDWKSKVWEALSAAHTLSGNFGNRKIVLCRNPKFSGILRKSLNQDLKSDDLFNEEIDIGKVVFESSLFEV